MSHSIKKVPDPRLFDLACRAFQNAYAPYSNFHVGAAILDENGAVHAGGNVENAAYPQGNCAEASAIAAMIFAGGRKIREIVIIGRSEHLVMPCGGCRQRLAEFCAEDARIYIGSPDALLAEFSLGEIFPHQFGKDNL